MPLKAAPPNARRAKRRDLVSTARTTSGIELDVEHIDDYHAQVLTAATCFEAITNAEARARTGDEPDKEKFIAEVETVLSLVLITQEDVDEEAILN